MMPSEAVGRLEASDLLAPVLLTTAIVIRFIKTRAEMGGWNKSSGAAQPK
jgi:hypothetical protein